MSIESEEIFDLYNRGEITEQERDEAINALAASGRAVAVSLDEDAA